MADNSQILPQRVLVWRSLDLRDLVCDVCESLAPHLASQRITIDIDVPFNQQVSADRELLRSGLWNLVKNAIDAMPQGGDLVITSWQDQQGIEIEVADSGPGICRDSQRELFSPHFTTKPGATGLGLTFVQQMAQLHGGNVYVANCPEGGAAFTIRIPRFAVRAAA